MKHVDRVASQGELLAEMEKGKNELETALNLEHVGFVDEGGRLVIGYYVLYAILEKIYSTK